MCLILTAQWAPEAGSTPEGLLSAMLSVAATKLKLYRKTLNRWLFRTYRFQDLGACWWEGRLNGQNGNTKGRQGQGEKADSVVVVRVTQSRPCMWTQ